MGVKFTSMDLEVVGICEHHDCGGLFGGVTQKGKSGEHDLWISR
jgi:hypothetical protein